SPIFISAGLPSRYSPSALNTALRNPTSPARSAVKILGVTVCQPRGVKLLTCSPEEQGERRLRQPASIGGNLDRGLIGAVDVDGMIRAVRLGAPTRHQCAQRAH